MFKWSIVRKNIAELKDYHKNPRQLSQRQYKELRKSLERFGITDKPIINTDGTIIGGHQRKNTLKKMGYTELEVLIPDRPLDDREIEELNIRLNKNTGAWDMDILANEFNIDDLIEWGFTKEELSINDIEEEKDPFGIHLTTT